MDGEIAYGQLDVMDIDTEANVLHLRCITPYPVDFLLDPLTSRSGIPRRFERTADGRIPLPRKGWARLLQ